MDASVVIRNDEETGYGFRHLSSTVLIQRHVRRKLPSGETGYICVTHPPLQAIAMTLLWIARDGIVRRLYQRDRGNGNPLNRGCDGHAKLVPRGTRFRAAGSKI